MIAKRQIVLLGPCLGPRMQYPLHIHQILRTEVHLCL